MYEYYSYSYEYCNIRVHVADPVIPVRSRCGWASHLTGHGCKGHARCRLHEALIGLLCRRAIHHLSLLHQLLLLLLQMHLLLCLFHLIDLFELRRDQGGVGHCSRSGGHRHGPNPHAGTGCRNCPCCLPRCRTRPPSWRTWRTAHAQHASMRQQSMHGCLHRCCGCRCRCRCRMLPAAQREEVDAVELNLGRSPQTQIPLPA